jgi:hypothetical protein
MKYMISWYERPQAHLRQFAAEDRRNLLILLPALAARNKM